MITSDFKPAAAKIVDINIKNKCYKLFKNTTFKLHLNM